MSNRYVSVLVPITGQASGATATLAVATIPAGFRLKDAHVECSEEADFSAGTTTGVDAVLGVAGTTNGYLATAALTTLTPGDMSDLGGPGSLVNRLRVAANDVILTITATGGTPDVDEISAGAYWVHLHYETARERIR